MSPATIWNRSGTGGRMTMARSRPPSPTMTGYQVPRRVLQQNEGDDDVAGPGQAGS
jgi:hypothetical protein